MLKAFPYVFFTVLVFFILFQMVPMGDDKYPLQLLNQYGGLGGTLANYFNTWGGRLPQTFVWLLFSKLPMKVWAAVTSACFAVFLYFLFHSGSFDISKLGNGRSLALKTTACAFFFLVSFSTLNGGFFWFTGSFYYFFSVLGMLIAFMPLRRVWSGESDKLSIYLLALLPALYASFFEQTGLILIGMSLATIMYSIVNKKLSKFSVVYTLLIIVCFTVGFTSPGNHVRNINETLRWYPDYNMLSVPDKLFTGICETMNHCFNDCVLLLAVIAIFVVLLFNDKYKNKWVTLISSIPLMFLTVLIFPFGIFAGTNVVNKNIAGTVSLYLNNFTKFSASNKYSPKFYIGAVIGLAVLLFLCCLVFLCFDNKKKGVFNLLFFAAAICAGVVIGFSPTVYASGNRVFFASDILLVLVAVNMTAEVFTKLKKSKTVTAVCVGSLMLALINLLTYITQLKSMI